MLKIVPGLNRLYRGHIQNTPSIKTTFELNGTVAWHIFRILPHYDVKMT